MDDKDFTPDLTPDQMKRLGVLVGKYFEGNPREGNYFKTDASMSSWPESWHNEEHPLGWFQWYEGYAAGKRTPDDERQIKRWKSFKARHLAQLKKADPTLTNLSIQPRRRQALLHWGIAPGINMNEFEKAARVGKLLDRGLDFDQAVNLVKAAEYDPYVYDEIAKAQVVREANDLLNEKGFKPAFTSHLTSSIDSAEDLIDKHYESELRPLSLSSAKKTIGGGLVGAGLGAVAGAILARKMGLRDPGITALAGGALGGLGAGIATRHMTYGVAERNDDDLRQAETRNRFLEHLASNYEKI